MTAFELFEKAYMHYIGRFIGHLGVGASPKEYIRQAFSEELEEYSIEYVDSTGVILTYGNPTNKEQCNDARLQSIEIKAGYWLCYYSGHTGEWMLRWYASKSDAKTAYKNLYMRYFRYQDWFYTLRVR